MNEFANEKEGKPRPGRKAWLTTRLRIDTIEEGDTANRF